MLMDLQAKYSMKAYFMGKVAWCLKIAFFTLLVLILVSPTQVNPNAHTASVSSSKLTNVDSRLEESLKDLQPNDLVLVWVDIQAWIDRNNDTWLPADPAFYGIKWILITFDPDIEQNHLFWCLAEVEAGRVQEISEISWVKNITLVRVGGYVRLSENPKLGMKGMEYAIQRAINEGNKSLHVVLYVENQTMRMQGELNPPSDDRDAVLENVTAVISELGGEVLRTGSYKNKLVARVPAHVIEETAENPYISVIYHVGPIVFGGGTFPETQMAQEDKIIVEVWLYSPPEGRVRTRPTVRFAYDTTNRNSRIDTTLIYL